VTNGDGILVRDRYTGIQMDSRKVRPGNLFVCWPGLSRDPHEFLADARANGATGAVVHSGEGLAAADTLGLATTRWEPAEFADRAWRLCDEFYQHPTRGIKAVGITGTNGKTTTAWITRDALTSLGQTTAYLGTLGFQFPGHAEELPNTTPFVIDLYNLLDEARTAGVEAMVMEVSSHALAQKRADGLEFDVAAFLNLTQDHLDFHGSMAEYAGAKHRLFTELRDESTKDMTAIFNLDDATGREWDGLYEGPTRSFSQSCADASLRGIPESVGLESLRIRFESGGATAVATVPLGGSYNVENSVAATAILLALGYELEDAARAMETVRPVPGRFEPVRNDKGFTVIVDYAHTPDAVAKLLAAIRPLTSGRVITVFGCGGDRDRVKRPLMAQAATAGSDYVVATSDNPRTEDPEAILADVRPGLTGEFEVIVDRAEAIRSAIGRATPGDTVVIAGKGHENYQILGKVKHHFDDREVAREALR